LTRKVLTSSVTINGDTIGRFHNNLCQFDFQWKKYKTSNWIKAIKNALSTSLGDATLLSTHISFISNDEFGIIKADKPIDLKTLSHWLRYRKNSFNMWFKGYVNIRGENCNIATHLWKRRFIQWNGYQICLFNEFSGILVGVFDISNAKYLYYKEDTKDHFLENSFKIFSHDGLVEFQFDNKEKFGVGMNALRHLLD